MKLYESMSANFFNYPCCVKHKKQKIYEITNLVRLPFYELTYHDPAPKNKFFSKKWRALIVYARKKLCVAYNT